MVKNSILLVSCYRDCVIVLIFMFFSTTIGSAEEKTPEFFTFTFENDIFVGDDNGYTNGTGITFGKGPFKEFNESNLPPWLIWLTKDLYINTMKNKRHGVAHMFFQRMQTPNDLTKTELIANDVPYAGLLAWQGTLYAWDNDITDQLSFYLGTVGPNALAEQTQNFIHNITGSDKANGWDNQIRNEIVFKIEAHRIWNLYRTQGDGLQFDLLGLAGAGIGNLESATKAGFAIRWGSHLQTSFQSFSLQADRQVNPLSVSANNDFYIFFGGRAGIILNDILIDGNTFKDSHSVPLEHFQNQVSSGVVWSIGHSAFVFQVTSLSSRTTLTNTRENYGAFSITYH
ncbi:MAG: lipid A deacylase LpxR family protein, partial [Gammaproteobacteria bacterium]